MTIEMTSEQFEAFKKLYKRYYGFRFFFALKAIENNSEFSSLYDLATFDAIHNLNFAKLWAYYDADYPVQLINVIHDR